MNLGITYLLVSDDPELLLNLRVASEAAGGTVLATGDALYARRLAATAWPDVIITAEVGPGAEWLRTLPQPWTETSPAEDLHLPSGVRVFLSNTQRP